MAERGLYPAIEPARLRRIAVGSHEIYVEECGNPEGVPVVFIHGGPGSSCKPYHRQFFDPQRYRIVLFDQRGAGQSKPRGGVAENTTQDLLNDMEVIRDALQISCWVLFGGSWGATLALLYAERYPERVAALVIRGTFLAGPEELAWFYGDGAKRVFPDAWEAFTRTLSEEERADVVSAYHERVHNGSGAAALAAAQAWADWGTSVVTYSLAADARHTSGNGGGSEKVLEEVRVETHYAMHRYFLQPNEILRNIGAIPEVPTHIIHGRRDMTCTLDASWRVHRAMPHSTLTILEESGHLANEPAMINALVRATDEVADVL